MAQLRAWARNLLRRKRVERELDEELRAYVELMSDEKMRDGMTPEDAARETKRGMGGVEQVRQSVRDGRAGVALERLAQDLRYALRTMERNPVFAAVLMATLALGIGVNTAIFTLIQGILLRSLPVADPGMLYRIGSRTTCCYFASFENDDGEFDLF